RCCNRVQLICCCTRLHIIEAFRLINRISRVRVNPILEDKPQLRLCNICDCHVYHLPLTLIIERSWSEGGGISENMSRFLIFFIKMWYNTIEGSEVNEFI